MFFRMERILDFDMNTSRALLLPTLVLFLGQGCSSTMIAPPERVDFTRLRVGMTRTDVLDLLGLPNFVEKQVSAEGGISWTWGYSRNIAATTLHLPGTGLPPSKDSQPPDLARIVWSPEGTVRELQLPEAPR